MASQVKRAHPGILGGSGPAVACGRVEGLSNEIAAAEAAGAGQPMVLYATPASFQRRGDALLEHLQRRRQVSRRARRPERRRGQGRSTRPWPISKRMETRARWQQ